MSSKITEELRQEVAERMIPDILRRGYQAASKRSQFPIRFFRARRSVLDTLFIQFDKYGRPGFVLQFRPIEKSDEIKLFQAKDANAIPLSFGFRAYAQKGPFFPRWFSIGLLRRSFCRRKAIRSVVGQAIERLADIDHFLIESVRSPAIVEDGTWALAGKVDYEFSPPEQLATMMRGSG